MNYKGFTLVELLAVLGVLAVITLITVPTIDSTLKKNKERLYNDQIQTIKDGLRTWASSNTDYLPTKDGDTIELELGFLKVTGFTSSDIKNPKTDKCFPNDTLVIIKKSGNNYEYYVDDESGIEKSNDCEEPNKEMYVFSRGTYNIAVKKGDKLNDHGLFITNRLGENLKLEPYSRVYYNSTNTVITEIDTNVVGTYSIEYTYKYQRPGSGVTPIIELVFKRPVVVEE